MELRLVVVRTNRELELKEFYEKLGFQFEFHKHGMSPMHYSASAGPTVIEIYPLSKGQTSVDRNLRLGFAVDKFEDVIGNLRAAGVKIIVEASVTEFGTLAVVEDPDGRKVEIYKS